MAHIKNTTKISCLDFSYESTALEIPLFWLARCKLVLAKNKVIIYLCLLEMTIKIIRLWSFRMKNKDGLFLKQA